MTIQSIQKMMGPIGLAILTALYEGLARLGWGMMGIPYPEYFEKNPP
jgi:hypothetical protein